MTIFPKSQNPRRFFTFAVFGASAWMVFSAPAGHARPSVQPPPHNVSHRPVPGTNQWMTWPWTTAGLPYIMVERAIMREAIMGKGGVAPVLAKYRAAAMRSPADPFKQFCWAFASIGYTNPHEYIDDDALRALEGVDPGNIREYTRIRYYMLMRDEARKHPDLGPVAERLLKAEPQDTQIRNLYINDLSDHREGIAKALTLAKAEVSAAPKDSSASSILAGVYENMFLFSNKAADRDAAVREYERYLTLAPASDAFRPQATYLIKLLKSRHTTG